MMLISIAMTTYNGEKFLKEQLDSIIKQSFKDFEIIVCDDCSTDKTMDILKEYQKKYSFIRVYQNDKNIGAVKNFEQAIAKSRGEYIALSDQDDIWHKDKLKVQLEAIRDIKTPALIHSDLEMIDKNKTLLNPSYLKFKNYKLSNKKDLAHILGACGVMGGTILFNKALKEKILPFPKYIEVHDYYIALINELLGKRVLIDKPLVKYRIHTENLSNKKSKIDNSLFKRVKKFLKRELPMPYLNINRDKLLKEVLKIHNIKEEDKKLINLFLLYLENRKPSLILFYILVKNNLIRKNIFYRIELFFLFIWKQKKF